MGPLMWFYHSQGYVRCLLRSFNTMLLQLGWPLLEDPENAIEAFRRAFELASDSAAILDSLRELYSEKLRPLEEKGRYNQMREPALGDAWFDSKPMVLLIGQYSVGKTSFIRYLLGRDAPGRTLSP